MQIDIDFDVFKALTARRISEGDSYNAVLRRVLKLPDQQSALLKAASGSLDDPVSRAARGEYPNALSALAAEYDWKAARNALLATGAWFDNIHFPEGTRFQAIYKGQTYTAEIRDGRWVGGDGVARTSPSAAAGAISNTNVNGWRFWHVRLPGDPSWRKLDELKR